jgi:hypothetical protein
VVRKLSDDSIRSSVGGGLTLENAMRDVRPRRRSERMNPTVDNGADEDDGQRSENSKNYLEVPKHFYECTGPITERS